MLKLLAKPNILRSSEASDTACHNTMEDHGIITTQHPHSNKRNYGGSRAIHGPNVHIKYIHYMSGEENGNDNNVSDLKSSCGDLMFNEDDNLVKVPKGY